MGATKVGPVPSLWEGSNASAPVGNSKTEKAAPDRLAADGFLREKKKLWTIFPITVREHEPRVMSCWQATVMTVREMTFRVINRYRDNRLEVKKNFVAVEDRPDFCAAIELSGQADRCRERMLNRLANPASQPDRLGEYGGGNANDGQRKSS